MKIFLSFIPLFFICALTNAQVYNINEVDGLTISTCTGEFNDDGGFAHNC